LLPENISKEELIQYLRAELHNIDREAARLKIQRQSIYEKLEELEQNPERTSSFKESMSIEFPKLELTDELYEKSKVNKDTKSIFELATANYDQVNYSIFPIRDCNESSTSDIAIEFGFLNCENKENSQNESNKPYFQDLLEEKANKKLQNVETLSLKELEEIASSYGLKTTNEKIMRQSLKEIKEYLEKRVMPEMYLGRYKGSIKPIVGL